MSALTTAAPPPPGGDDEEMDWSPVFLQAPVHVLGHFLDRKDFAALQTTSARMQESVRNVLRARNEELPAGKRMGNLEGTFCVWKVVKEVLKREDRHPGDLVATGGYVWIVTEGGRINIQVNTVTSLDLVTKRYTTLAPMTAARLGHATAVVDGKLYVIGGFNRDDGPLPSVECLDLETWKWSEVAHMSTPRSDAGAAVLGGQIIVVGGCDERYQELSSVESFDPATGIWTAVASMSTVRSSHGVASAQGKLFAVGGYGLNDRGEYERLDSVECFEPSTYMASQRA